MFFSSFTVLKKVTWPDIAHNERLGIIGCRQYQAILISKFVFFKVWQKKLINDYVLLVYVLLDLF